MTAAAMAEPLFDGDPCGPDLDAAGDRDYQTVLATAQGELPGSYFAYLYPESEDDRVRIDFPAHTAALGKLASRSHDLRILVLRARFQILARDLQAFQRSVTTIAALIGRFWSEVHPGLDGDSVDLRRTELDALEAPTVIFPLQYVPLCENRRIGAVSWRAWLYAQNLAKPRPGEHTPSATALLDALRDGDPDEVGASRAAVTALLDALTSIRATWQERTRESPPLGKLLDLVRGIAGMMDQAMPAPPAAAPGLIARASTALGGLLSARSPAAAAPPLAEDIATSADAAAALAAVAGYFARFEPSNPALPLIEQAIKLRGRSFFEALQVLVPAYAEAASFRIGAQWTFDLALSRIAGGGDGAEAPAGDPAAASARSWAITTRAQALGLGAAVIGFYRLQEPSSPIPLLLERAAALAERDFLSLLRDVLPKDALRDPNAE